MRKWMSPLLLTLGVGSLWLTACNNGGVSENHRNRGLNPGVGPFDSRGNYVEAWADDQSKGRVWRKSKVVGGPQIAEVETSKRSPVVASKITPATTSAPKRTKQSTRRKPTPPVVGPTTPRRKSAVTSRSTSRPKPKSTAQAKPKRNSQPRRKASTSHTIKRGDTLYGLSRKYKTSVSAIQRANGMKGTNLRIGRTLVIPR